MKVNILKRRGKDGNDGEMTSTKTPKKVPLFRGIFTDKISLSYNNSMKGGG